MRSVSQVSPKLRMEACVVKPEVKKKPNPPKAPPKPAEVKRNEAERPGPVVPPRPRDDELSQTQYRLQSSAVENKQTDGNAKQRETKEKLPETPVIPPRPTEKELNNATRCSQRRRVQAEDMESFRETVQPETEEVPRDEADFKQSNESVLTGMFRQSHKEKTPTFTSYMIHTFDEEEKTDEAPVKQAPGSKPASRDPSPDSKAEEGGSEKEQSAEKNKPEKNAEPKQDKGGLLAGMFRKTPKEKLSSPAVMVSKANSDTEHAEEEGKTSEQSNEKGGFFSGILKKSNKPADEMSAQETLSAHSDLSASSDSLSENREKGKIFGGIFKKSRKPAEAAQTDEDQESLHGDLSSSTVNLNEAPSKEKGFFSGILRKSPKIPGEGTPGQDKELQWTDLSASSESLSENTKIREKGNVFSAMFKKSPKLSEGSRLEEDADSELSASKENLCENKQEKVGLFGGLLKKTPKASGDDEAAEDNDCQKELCASNDSLAENGKEKSGGLFGGLLKKTPKSSGEKVESSDREAQKELLGSNDDLSENSSTKEKNIFSSMFKKKPAESVTAEKESEGNAEDQFSGSSENLTGTTVPKEKKGGLAGIFKRSASIENLFDEEKGGLFGGLIKKTPKASRDDEAAEDKEMSASNDSLAENDNTKEKNIFSGMFKKTQKPADEESNTGEDKKLSSSCENLLEATGSKEKTGRFAGIFKKSPKPAPRSIATQDPLSDSKLLSASCDSLPETEQEDLSAHGELLGSTDDLNEATGATKERKGAFVGMFKRTPKTVEQQEGEGLVAPEGGGLRRRRTIKKKRRVVSFRVKTTLPRIPKLILPSQSSEKLPLVQETVELQDLNLAQENTVEVQQVEMAAYPTQENPAETEQEPDELIEWWNTVKGWTEWNESSNFQAEDEEMAMEQAADRVYMAARLFVRLFNQRGASLQQRILELVALADAADQFHKKTVTAAVGGGVASVAGSVATITGLILAPFTFGASIIVTAVGISVATAGSITSATANITDTVHSNLDRKKVEKMIQGYEEEIKDIRECMEFVQEGIDTLEEWDFSKYSESAAKKALNHNIKHVMKEGGRAGKALMINTDKLISTVQVLGAAGGVAKAAQAISVTTGVMSALFLALDVFFLAKDSHKLRKGAKTKFAAKIREVCKDLQDGLLELNKVKTQLQKTMDGIEVEEYEQIEEVEVEVDDDLESDPKKLAELEQELDLLEEKLDKKVEEELKKGKEAEKENLKSKKEKKEEKVESEEKKEEEETKEEGDDSKKEEKEEEEESKLEEKEPKHEKSVKTSKEEVLKEQSQQGSKKDKEAENRLTAGKEKHESKRDKTKEETGANKTADRKEKEKNKTETEQEEVKSRSVDDRSLKMHLENRESGRRRSSREEKPEGNKEERRHSTRSDRYETREGDRTKSRRRREEEERGATDWRAELTKNREDKPESRVADRATKREDRGKTALHRSHETSREHPEREAPKTSHHRGEERRGSRVESTRRQFERAGGGEVEEERMKREDGGSRRRERRGSDRERGHENSRRESRPRSNALLEDGLYI
ncbi:uncharacterized protein LOC111585752 isoform X4 [Amphiprion ocellaris]|uniref:uncharacterized protein LOC111585752 isoform X4 n=1 Tax=Amphiprion ocellaris TaxID=80972 RepID=UPI0024113515|nr:uncharacterized protein LOC111585752 isoform X4 [Amphiprion ocellaris]